MEKELENKIRRAIKLIQLSAPQDGSPIEVAYSGGKDSDVILQLVKESGVNYRALYKNTTIDPPYTRKHALDMGAEVIMPKRTFKEIVEENGYPTRFRRFCCSKLKEYKILDKCVIGVRREESVKRRERYKEPTQCRFYGSKKEHVEAIYPILDWTSSDVADFVKDRGIMCHPLYYDQDGNFHPERRLGCVGCPLASKKKRREQFRDYPNMLKAWIRYGDSYLNNHPHDDYQNGYEYMARELFFDTQAEWRESKEQLFEKVDYKAFLENYFNTKL